MAQKIRSEGFSYAVVYCVLFFLYQNEQFIYKIETNKGVIEKDIEPTMKAAPLNYLQMTDGDNHDHDDIIIIIIIIIFFFF